MSVRSDASEYVCILYVSIPNKSRCESFVWHIRARFFSRSLSLTLSWGRSRGHITLNTVTHTIYVYVSKIHSTFRCGNHTHTQTHTKTAIAIIHIRDGNIFRQQRFHGPHVGTGEEFVPAFMITFSSVVSVALFRLLSDGSERKRIPYRVRNRIPIKNDMFVCVFISRSHIIYTSFRICG